MTFCKIQIGFEIDYKAVETANSKGIDSIECGMNPTSIEKVYSFNNTVLQTFG